MVTGLGEAETGRWFVGQGVVRACHIPELRRSSMVEVRQRMGTPDFLQ